MSDLRYQLLVFDWDGTLADSIAHIIAAMQSAVCEADLAPPAEDALLAVIGLGLDQAFSELFPSLPAPARGRLAAAYRRHYLLATTEPVPLYPRVREIIPALCRRGYTLAVATGKSRRGLDRALEESGLGGYFQASRCADETISKPHPQMLFEIMETVGAPPGRTLMIGDSHHDLQMAGNAGVAGIAVNYGAQPVHRLLEFNPIASIHDLAELATWLDNQPRTDEQHDGS
jgi:phosphoglycolate phosphatase